MCNHADSYECILRYRGGILKIALFLLCVCILGFGLLHATITRISSHATAIMGCQDIPASPNYLAAEHAPDAIAALNNAHRVEHLPLYAYRRTFTSLTLFSSNFFCSIRSVLYVVSRLFAWTPIFHRWHRAIANN